MKRVVASVLLLTISACSPTATPATSIVPPSSGTPPPVTFGTPSPTIAGGAEGLVEDLVAGGATAKLGSNFLAKPLPGEGVLICVGTEAVQVYVLKDHEAALAAASTIDPEDPSQIGTSIVEWAGRPRFWLSDRILVLYVGDDDATDTALRSLLGEPFAEARVPGRPPLPAPDCA
jgi:hypothetical protein